jgi:rhodanese-related sulfurtransferase
MPDMLPPWILRPSLTVEVILILSLSLICAVSFNVLSSNGIPLFYHSIAISPEERLSDTQTEEILKQKRALFIDARTPEEYNAGHIPGAVNIPGYATPDKIMHDLPLNRKQTMIVVYCSGPECPYADRLAGFLRFQEFSAVYVYPGGIDAWLQAGNILEKENDIR